MAFMVFIVFIVFIAFLAFIAFMFLLWPALGLNSLCRCRSATSEMIFSWASSLRHRGDDLFLGCSLRHHGELRGAIYCDD